MSGVSYSFLNDAELYGSAIRAAPRPAVAKPQLSDPSPRAESRAESKDRLHSPHHNFLLIQAMERRMHALEVAVFEERRQSSMAWLAAGLCGVILLALLLLRGPSRRSYRVAPRAQYVGGHLAEPPSSFL
jgi:hypothetical protein